MDYSTGLCTALAPKYKSGLNQRAAPRWIAKVWEREGQQTRKREKTNTETAASAARLNLSWRCFVLAAWWQEGHRHKEHLLEYGLARRHEWASSAAIRPSPRLLLPAVPLCSQRGPGCQLRHNSFLCWLALYENLMVIAHRLPIRVRDRGGEWNWLWKEYLGGKNWGHNCGLKDTESYSEGSRRKSGVRVTLAEGQRRRETDSDEKSGEPYIPHYGQIKIPLGSVCAPSLFESLKNLCELQ